MKILYYSPHPHLHLEAPTGYGTHMREMINAWRNMGIEVRTLIAGHSGEGRYKAPAVAKSMRGIKKFIPAIVWETLKDLHLIRFDSNMEKRLEKAVREFQPDLIYERAAYLQNSGTKIAKRTATRHVVEFNAPYPLERVAMSGKSFLIHTARDNERQILIEANNIVVVSTALKAHFEKILAGVSAKILVVPNCVNPEKVHHEPAEVAKLKNHYGLSDHLVIGFVGSIFPYHGVDMLIHAFAQAKNRHLARLLIVGDGYTLPDLKALAKKLGVHSEVIFTGSVPHREVYLHIDVMDICCLSRNDWYMSPVKLFEYGLMKKPVVASKTSSVRDVMTADDALLVEENIDQFSNALDKLLMDSALREKLAANWHKKVMENHTWDIAARNILDTCV